MTDLARLTKALAELDEDYPDWEWAAKAMTPAARLVVDGQDVRWCEGHLVGAVVAKGRSWSCPYRREPNACRMVAARLVFPKART